VHRELAAALAKAERALLVKYPGRTPAALAKELGVYELKGLRPPRKATGGGLPSYHCFGLAVDINYAGNIFLGQTSRSNKVTQAKGDASTGIVKHATLLLWGKMVDPRAKPEPAKDVGAQWDRLHAQSEAVKTYLSLSESELAARVGSGVGGHDLAWWRNRQVKDRIEGTRGEFSGHRAPGTHGFMDLSRELVLALAGAGLNWGGMFNTGKDIMHFDLRTGTVRQHK
jgi:hypothetical protein